MISEREKEPKTWAANSLYNLNKIGLNCNEKNTDMTRIYLVLQTSTI